MASTIRMGGLLPGIVYRGRVNSDGYTILLATNAYSVNASLYKLRKH